MFSWRKFLERDPAGEETYVDAALSSLQTDSCQDQVVRLRLVPVRLEVVTMTRVIEFYIPDRFKQPVKWIPLEERGKIIEFPVPKKKSA